MRSPARASEATSPSAQWTAFSSGRLTGGRVHATDATNAARTNLFDIHTCAWSPELLALFDIPESVLPEVRGNADGFGTTDLLGAPVPVAGLAGDQQAATLGQGCVSAGDVKSTYGTGCFLLAHTGAEPVVSRPPAAYHRRAPPRRPNRLRARRRRLRCRSGGAMAARRTGRDRRRGGYGGAGARGGRERRGHGAGLRRPGRALVGRGCARRALRPHPRHRPGRARPRRAGGRGTPDRRPAGCGGRRRPQARADTDRRRDERERLVRPDPRRRRRSDRGTPGRHRDHGLGARPCWRASASARSPTRPTPPAARAGSSLPATIPHQPAPAGPTRWPARSRGGPRGRPPSLRTGGSAPVPPELEPRLQAGHSVARGCGS